MNEKVSIIAGCMNRADQLVKVIHTWVTAPEVTEIIIVDWNSTVEVQKELSHIDHPHVKVIRVNNAGPWVLSLALNLASKYVTNQLLLKLDCDNMLKPDFFRSHPLKSTDRIFYTGNWENARNDNEQHLNGVVYLPTHEFRRVGGYNEHIRTYGWDDTDLYTRLSNNSMEKKDINNNTIKHLPHANSQRSFFSDLELKIAENMHLAEEYIWGYGKAFTEYIEIVASTGNFKVLTPVDIEKNTPSAEAVARCNSKALRTILCKFGFPWEATENKSRTFLLDLYNRRNLPKFIIEPKNGLGNRLRALASAAVVARNTGRNLLVVWIPDDHYNCKFNEHFVDSDLCVVSCLLKGYDPIQNLPPNQYNNCNSFSKPVQFESCDDIYVVSATILDNVNTSWSQECAWLRTNIQPIKSIQKQINYYKQLFEIENVFGLHIRMGQSADKYSFEDWSKYSPEQKAAAARNRGASHYSYFMAEMDKIWKVNPDQVFFLCADDKSIYKAFKKRYTGKQGSHIVHVPKHVYDRSAGQITGAIIDVYLLSMCGKGLLASPWSSFSELANRLGQNNMKISGTDFGMKQFALLFYPGSYNIGDDIQTLAASQFIPTPSGQPDYLVDRDNPGFIYDCYGNAPLNANAVADNVKIIMNSWYDGRQTVFPPHPKLKPLFISFHLNETPGLYDHKDYEVSRKNMDPNRTLLTPDVIKYLQDNGPMGTRDIHTLKLFRNVGIDAFHTSCLTLTLDPVKLGLQTTSNRTQIYVVDADHAETSLYEKLVPIAIRNKAKSLTHGLTGHLPNYSEKKKRALELLQHYCTAKLVITNRLHVALPCVAFGTPVLFVHSKVSVDPRFDETIVKLIGDGKSIPQGWNWDSPKLTKEQKTLAKALAGELEKMATEFIKKQ